MIPSLSAAQMIEVDRAMIEDYHLEKAKVYVLSLKHLDFLV